jgi:hypothetical protein
MIKQTTGILALTLFLLTPTVAVSGETLFDLGEPDALMLPLPAGWEHEIISSAGGMPPTIQLKLGSEASFAVLLTPFLTGPSTLPDFDSPENIRSVVESIAAEAAPRAAEDRLTVEAISGRNVGYMFFATDKFLVGRPIPPNEYLYVVQGAVMVGKLLCNFTILMNDRPSPDAELALEMLRNAVHRTGT